LKCVKAKKDGIVSKIYVVGCLSQLYANELKKEIPEVDGFMGVNYIERILNEIGYIYYSDYSMIGY
jgi:ribosomal protein S12 methylthiotransferase